MSTYTFPYKQVITRAAHDCAWCDESIPASSKVYAGMTINDGQWLAGWMHPECHAAMEASRFFDGTFDPGSFDRGVPVDEITPIGQ